MATLAVRAVVIEGLTAVDAMAAKQRFKYAEGIFAHIQIAVRDLMAMTAFYDAVLSELDISRVTLT